MTHQPVKGRKRAGGMRFGEMERDALLSHGENCSWSFLYEFMIVLQFLQLSGCAYILYDRLLMCSDVTKVHLCDKCNCLLSPLLGKSNFILTTFGIPDYYKYCYINVVTYHICIYIYIYTNSTIHTLWLRSLLGVVLYMYDLES